jgi:hypothetical protein
MNILQVGRTTVDGVFTSRLCLQFPNGLILKTDSILNAGASVRGKLAGDFNAILNSLIERGFEVQGREILENITS